MFPSFRDEIVDSWEDSFKQRKLWIEAEQEEHEEEEERPERRNGEKTDGFRVRDEREALARFDDILNSFDSSLALEFSWKNWIVFKYK